MAESAPKAVSDQGIDVPEKWIQFVDDNIVASMFITVACALEAFDLKFMWQNSLKTLVFRAFILMEPATGRGQQRSRPSRPTGLHYLFF